MPLESVAKTLMLAALGLLAVGAALFVFAKLGLPRLPGDVVLEGRNWKVYVPLATSLLISVILTLVINVVLRIFR